jgi:hypothetical protein
MFEYGAHCSPSPPLEFCLWGWMKSEVYQKKSEDQLRQTTGDICTRAAKCTEVGGGFVEHLL